MTALLWFFYLGIGIPFSIWAKHWGGYPEFDKTPTPIALLVGTMLWPLIAVTRLILLWVDWTERNEP